MQIAGFRLIRALGTLRAGWKFLVVALLFIAACFVYIEIFFESDSFLIDQSSLRQQPILLDIVRTSTESSPRAEPKLGSSQRNQVGTTRLIDEFSKLRSGRKFVLDAWKRPADGGKFYGSYIVDRCRFIKDFTDLPGRGQPETPKSTNEHLAVIVSFDRLKELCEQFTESELSEFSGNAVLFQALNNDDALISIVKEFSAATTSKELNARRKATIEVLDAADPLLFDSLGSRLSMFHGESGAFLYFDGQTLLARDNSALMAAYYLLPCGMGLDCSQAGDVGLLIRCATQSICFSDRFSQTLAESAAGDPVKFKRILDVYALLLEAVKSKNTDKFIPK